MQWIGVGIVRVNGRGCRSAPPGPGGRASPGPCATCARAYVDVYVGEKQYHVYEKGGHEVGVYESSGYEEGGGMLVMVLSTPVFFFGVPTRCSKLRGFWKYGTNLFLALPAGQLLV